MNIDKKEKIIKKDNIKENKEKSFRMYQYNDGMLSGRRFPKLYLAKGGEIVEFEGENIPGYCAISKLKFKKMGKWSNTDFEMLLGKGVKPLKFVSPLHGTWGDNISNWGEAAEKLSLPIDTVKSLIRKEYPRTADRLDDMEVFAISLEENEQEMEIVNVSFGSPTNRAIKEGYWENSKRAFTSDGVEVVVAPDPDWNQPKIIEPQDAKVISVRHSPGMHGGYWNIEVGVSAKS